MKVKYSNTPKVPMDGNTACTHSAYLTSENIAIYPITPSSPMGEIADAKAAEGERNFLGHIPLVIEMQAEGGAAGAVHGALSVGSLTTTFTASQGLLLMIPNMYKIAGELTPTVFNVAARSLSAQALSIFGDHQDVMATRDTGFAMLASNNPQEAMDFAAIAMKATLISRIPFLHFFDGFRTSHEIQKVNILPAEFFKDYIPIETIYDKRERGMNPLKPTIRGTAQNPDYYFQGREAVNKYYEKGYDIVLDSMKSFESLTGRKYRPFEYVGAKDAKYVIVIMGSGADTVVETVKWLNNKKKKVGVLKVRLFRPFGSKELVKAIPKSAKRIAVLDRTKSIGTDGEPLYLEVKNAISNAALGFDGFPPRKGVIVVGGRYGLSSKEFTPTLVNTVFEHLSNLNKIKKSLWTNFTLGIDDDITHRSLKIEKEINIKGKETYEAKFYGLGSDGTVGANKNSIKMIGDNTNNNVQGYFVYDSKKAGAVTISHLRSSLKSVNSPYLIEHPNFVAVHNPSFLTRFNVLEGIKDNGIFLLNTNTPEDKVWESIPENIQSIIIKKHITVYAINAFKIASEEGLGGRINTTMQAAFFKISKILDEKVWLKDLENRIKNTYGKKGKSIVASNIKALHRGYKDIFKVKIGKIGSEVKAEKYDFKFPDKEIKAYYENIMKPIIAGKGDSIPVSKVSENGVFPSDTCRYEKRNIAILLPRWDPELCIQCNQCVAACPHSTIISKLISEINIKKYVKNQGAEHFITKKAIGVKDDLQYRIQILPDDCTGCGVCFNVCPGIERDPKTKKPTGRKALEMVQKESVYNEYRKTEKIWNNIPETDRKYIDKFTTKNIGFIPALFAYSGACAGCGETPYVRLLTQLSGERTIIANATGCSSIYGGTVPGFPYVVSERGMGPSWSNSLFEDNAEFGLGMSIANEKLKEVGRNAFINLKKSWKTRNAHKDIIALMNRIEKSWDDRDTENYYYIDGLLKELVNKINGFTKNDIIKSEKYDFNDLKSTLPHIVLKTIWVVGGDGWAYDIGYGGLDHVLASNRDINVLVLDTEVYSNTGGQCSKATPLGAIAKFAAAGKRLVKKDLAMMAMSYGYVYVATIAINANHTQSLKAMKEAIEYEGPSIIIAHSPCIEHGYNLMKNPEQQKLAVNSGIWPIFRYDPRLTKGGKNPLQLDIKKITIPTEECLLNENRFKRLVAERPKEAKVIFQEIDKLTKERFEHLKKLASL